ncbi:sensor histidine kinase [Isoptericola sp. NPDC019693]|uniref:sensor histidine kinase n=1 Tax=Isoptericola sp. NPDC019693 TaxID=3364009 RepID=UPI0037AEECC5
MAALTLSPAWQTARRRRRERTAVAVAVLNVVVFTVLVTEQAVEWDGDADAADLAWWVGGVTLVIGLVLVGLIVAVNRWVRPWPARLAVAAALAAGQALVRLLILVPIMSAPDAVSPGGFAAWVTGMLGYSGALGAGLLVAWFLQREDDERERRLAQEARAAATVRELEAEELRVRRSVADRLHGTVQQRLVVISGGLDALAAELDEPARSRWRETLRGWAEDLDELREEDIRVLSHSLFPSGADLGTFDAVRTLLGRLPVSVATSLTLGPTLQRLVDAHRAPLPVPERLVVVYVIEEAVTNALRHGGATAVTVRAEVRPDAAPDGRRVLDVVVDDDGSGPDSADPALSGLARHRARAESRGGALTLGVNDDGGGRLHLVLPFEPGTAPGTAGSVDDEP